MGNTDKGLPINKPYGHMDCLVAKEPCRIYCGNIWYSRLYSSVKMSFNYFSIV